MESESGISFTEFTYQLLQGYDFVHLARNHGVRMQVCERLCHGLTMHSVQTSFPSTVQHAKKCCM